MNRSPRITINQCLTYEVHSGWLSQFVVFDWTKKLLARYYAYKVKNKYRRYTNSMDVSDKMRKWTEIYDHLSRN